MPSDLIARNVLQQEFSVPSERLDDVLATLKDNGAYVGFIQDTKTGPFVSIEDPRPSPVTVPSEPPVKSDPKAPPADSPEAIPNATQIAESELRKEAQTTFRVFITHGKNMQIVEQVKDVLELYDIDYEIAVEEETTAIPVSQKVLGAMRRCQAGVMIVSADEPLGDPSLSKINNNVLIEIGAAFVLYDQKVVLLWDKTLKVPSNLQGLYRCEFEGKPTLICRRHEVGQGSQEFSKVTGQSGIASGLISPSRLITLGVAGGIPRSRSRVFSVAGRTPRQLWRGWFAADEELPAFRRAPSAAPRRARSTAGAGCRQDPLPCAAGRRRRRAHRCH
jgi:hypothetical protein